ncbi:MAG TPA: hypothetical protein DCE44_22350, partial [Verrucomicrobiales bacterium]|nr:hypothetical protein [Verrucomicrobiales bacterium]
FASAAWGDFYNRGLLDLYICNYGGTNVFYRNDGDGTFSKVTPGEDPVRSAGYHVGPDHSPLTTDHLPLDRPTPSHNRTDRQLHEPVASCVPRREAPKPCG